MYYLNNILFILIVKWDICILTLTLFITDITPKIKQKMKENIWIDLNYKYSNIIPIYKVHCNYKENIVNRNMNKIFESGIFASDEEHDDNNIPNYDLFNKHIVDIFW